MPRLKLFLFGPPHLERDGQSLEIDARKTMALLAYLGITGTSHSRETLLTLLWPDLEPRQAQNVLRRNLSTLNKTLNGQWLVVEQDIIGLDKKTDAWLDVTHFRYLAQSWRDHNHSQTDLCANCLSNLAQAASLYRADFMAGFGVRNSPNFDNWQLFETEQLKRELASVLERLLKGHSERREIDQAISYAQRWLALDPLHEPAHRHLMRLFAANGDRSAALRQYQNCVQLLKDELGVPPEAETIALYESLRQETKKHQKIIAEAFAIIDGDSAAGLKRNLIGSGGMGNVYRGLNRQSGEAVAIKVLKPEIIDGNPDLVERFVREGQALRRLNHPNIVKMLAASEQDSQLYLVMEYVAGGSLKDLIANEELLPRDRALDIALYLADALTRAHRLKIIHRDLKPANILLAEDGTPRLADFGVARMVNSSQLTKTSQILGTVDYLSPEGCEGLPLDERADIWAFGVILYEMLTGEHPFKGETVVSTLSAILTQPVPRRMQSRTDIPAALIDLIERMLQKDPAQRIPSVRLVGAELEAIIADRPVTPDIPNSMTGPPPPSPYRGLFAFQEQDAPNFFGRETFTRQLVEAVHERALVAVVGPSGSGKSSVVFAGLLPQLRQEANWIIVPFRPGSDPFWGLAAALIPYLESELSETDRLVETHKLARSMRSGELFLDDVVNRILQKNSAASRLLLLTDQFEELYTLCPEPELRYSFIDSLLDIVELQPFKRAPTFNIVFTLRADFLEQVLAYRPMADVIQDADLMLGPMIREELSQAIELPAEKLGVTFEAGLVERILDDVGEEPGKLPLLEFALAMLWEQQQKRVLSHRGYEAIARVEGALTGYADQVYAGLSLTEQEIARQIFVQLVRPGEGTEDTRRVAHRDELSSQDWILGQRLADARLVVTGRDAAGNETVEVVHEALIRNWGRFRQWIEDDRTFRSWQERLRASMRQWEAAQQNKGALLHGIALAEAEGWLAEREADLSQAERTFIQASIDLKEAIATERERDRLARERLRQRIIQGLVAGLLLAILLLTVAGWQWLRAEQQRQVAEDAKNHLAAERDQAQLALSRQLATQAIARQNDQLDLGLLLSVEANRITQTVDARRSLRAGLVSNSRLTTYLHAHDDRVTSVAFSADGQTMASGSNDNTIVLWDVASGLPLTPPLTGHEDNVLSIDFSPVDQIVASAGDDKTIRLWDAATGQSINPPLTGHTSSVSSVNFSPDGQALASSGGKTIILWDLTSSPPLSSTLTGHSGPVRTVSFSPDGQILASGSDDETIILWDVVTGEPFGPPLIGHTDLVRSVSFSPDGQILASASENGIIILWDMSDSPTFNQTLDGHTSSVRSVAFSPNSLPDTGGHLLASAGTDGSVILWDTASGQPLGSPLTGHTDWVRSVAFSPDGKTLASASHDHKIILWDVTSQELDTFALGPPIAGHLEGVRSVAFSPDGQTLASGSDDETVILWDAATSEPLGPPLTGHTEGVRSVTFSPDGKTLASSSDDETIILWDVATGEPLGPPLTGHTASVRSVAFSPDGQTLASGSKDETIIIWDVATGEPLGSPITGHAQGVQNVAFSPNGRFLASAGDDKNIKLWDISGNPLLNATLSGHEDVVFSIAFSPDGQTLASSSWDKTIRLWDVDSGQSIGLPMRGHTEGVQSVTFSPDGKTLASGGWDETIFLWDPASGLPITAMPPLTGHTGSVRSIAFSPDGRSLASASDDGTIILWDVDLKSWQARACRRANRNLSKLEWQQFFGEQDFLATCPDLPVPLD